MIGTAIYGILARLTAEVGIAIDRVQANATIEEVELRAASAQATVDELRLKIDGSGVRAEPLSTCVEIPFRG